MTERRVTLTRRFGQVHIDPSADDMCAAIDEVLTEGRLGLPEADLVEHPNAWMTRGWPDGASWALLVVDVHRSGDVIVSRWADQDDKTPLYEHRLPRLSAADCLILWCIVADGSEAVLLHRVAELR